MSHARLDWPLGERTLFIAARTSLYVRPDDERRTIPGDKIMQRTIVLGMVVLALTAQIHAAQEVPEGLQEAIRLRAQAVAKKDAAVWDRLTTADFTTVLEDGHLQTKADRLIQLKGEKPEALPPAPLAERFSTHGNTVIQRTQAQDRSWIMTVWVKDGQDWRVAAVQITPAPKK